MKFGRRMTAMLLTACIAVSAVPAAGAVETVQLAENDAVTRTAKQSAQKVCTTVKEAAAIVREQMKNREEEIEVTYNIPLTNDFAQALETLPDTICDAAMEHTGVSDEGDYIKWQMGDVECGCDAAAQISDDTIQAHFVFYPTYYTTLEQEQQMTKELKKIEAQIIKKDATDYEKVKAIYDYICTNVKYDTENLNNPDYTLKHTAYAALFHHKSVCQGYALLFYRMALDQGIDARFIPGTGFNGKNNEEHGWNIVKLDGAYYYADTTWDAQMEPDIYFLKCEKNFKNHTRSAEYNTKEFNKLYPMADYDYHTHNWGKGVVTKEGSCAEYNEVTYTCSICGGKTFKKEAGTKHTIAANEEIAATCTAAGKTGGTHCTVCNKVLTESTVVPALGHSWGKASVTKKATCKDKGEQTYTCSRCKQVKKEEIAALGHKWDAGKVTKEPTTTATGTKEYTCTVCSKNKIEELPTIQMKFTDVPDTEYYAAPVAWAVGKGITNGISATSFGPNMYCTRAQIVTFLWRAKGEPEPTSTKNPFKDVSSKDYYYKAVMWAVEKKITTGVTATSFAPDTACTRAQAITFIWRAEGSQTSTGKLAFKDVKAGEYYEKAVVWGVANKVVNGMSATSFAPDMRCTRGQIVTFLHRDMVK